MVSEVQGGKNGLRSTCRSLRQAVNDCTSALTWTRPWGLGGGPVLYAHLPAALTGACPGIKLLDCCGPGPGAILEFDFESCPLSLHTLICGYTHLRLLGPLAVKCTMLQTFKCYNTEVAELGPLSACTMLQTLDCSATRVTHLGPLSACTMLQTLDCMCCMQVTQLGPLSACMKLQNFNCSGGSVADLGPLSACTML